MPLKIRILKGLRIRSMVYVCLWLMRNTNRLNDTPISIKSHFNDDYQVSNCTKDLFKENSEEKFI